MRPILWTISNSRIEHHPRNSCRQIIFVVADVTSENVHFFEKKCVFCIHNMLRLISLVCYRGHRRVALCASTTNHVCSTSAVDVGAASGASHQHSATAVANIGHSTISRRRHMRQRRSFECTAVALRHCGHRAAAATTTTATSVVVHNVHVCRTWPTLRKPSSAISGCSSSSSR